jgi:hypothetical protein
MDQNVKMLTTNQAKLINQEKASEGRRCYLNKM